MDSEQVKVSWSNVPSIDTDLNEMIAIDKDLEADRVIDAQKAELY